MDIGQDIQSVYEGVINLNPFTVFVVSFIGLALTLFFVYIYRNVLIESYGNKMYLWFFVLIALNLINILFITGYFQTKYQQTIGKNGPQGEIGKGGKKGDDSTCGYCTNSTEIGIQYSNKYYLINKIQKTTNILGEISIWRSIGMLGLASLGDTVFSQSSNTKARTYMAGFGSTQPKSFKKIMVISDGVNVTTIWEPEPKRGYSFIGHFATIGANPPDQSQVACLPTECLIKSNTFAYVGSFPAVDVIPSFSNKNLKFCSFWSTPLNHLYCKASTDNYSTNSLYFNIVEGHPEYYNNKKQEPITDKMDEVQRLLQDKPSIIYHSINNTSTDVKFNPIFIESIRDNQGNINGANIYASAFNKIMNNITTLETYIEIYQSSFSYIYKLTVDNDYPINYITENNETTIKGLSSFVILNDLIVKTSKDETKYSTIYNFINIYKNNPAVVTRAFQDPQLTFGVPYNLYANMSFIEKKQSFLSVLNSLDVDEMDAAINKLKNYGVETQSQLGLMDFNAKNKATQQQSSSFGTSEEPDPSLTLWDDLYYLFPAGFDDQIAATEEDSLNGGYYLLAIENRQRKNFVDYIKTFIKPNASSYSFRKKCVMAIDTDPERNEITIELVRVYNAVQDRLYEIAETKTCDNINQINSLYDKLMNKVSKQFGMIDNYLEKIANQEFSYFPTSRLKWLLNEMNTYYGQIQTLCKSDERLKVLNEIRVIKNQLKNDYHTYVNMDEQDVKILDINDQPIPDIQTKVDNMDVNDLTIDQLKQIREIFRKNLANKIKEIQQNTSS